MTCHTLSSLGDPLYYVFEYLDENSLVNASLTCKSCNDYANDERFWKVFTQNRGLTPEDTSHVKIQVINYLKRRNRYFVHTFPDVATELFPKISDCFKKCIIRSQSSSFHMVAAKPVSVFDEKIAVDLAIAKTLTQEALNQELKDCIENGHDEERIFFLIEAHAQVEDFHLDTATSCGKSPDIIKLLINKGAKPLKDTLDSALQRNYPHEIIALLLSIGAKSTENTSYYVERSENSKIRKLFE